MSDKIIVFGSRSCRHCKPHYERVKGICVGLKVEYKEIENGNGLDGYMKDVSKFKSFPVTLKISDSGKIKRSLVGAPQDVGVIKKCLGL